MKKLLFALLFLILAVPAFAQTTWMADVTVAWDEAQFATGYQVLVKGETDTLATMHDIGNVTQYTITGLQAGDLYTITVRGTNAWGEGPESDPAQVDLRKPGKPGNNRIVEVVGYKQ